MIVSYDLDFGHVRIYECCMVVVMNYGIVVNKETIDYFEALRDTHFKDKDFGYISIRSNSYSVDPNVYKIVSEWEHLKAFAIVDVQGISQRTFVLESGFFKGEMQLFKDLRQAYRWVLLKT